jgi:hypothetical protein
MAVEVASHTIMKRRADRARAGRFASRYHGVRAPGKMPLFA